MDQQGSREVSRNAPLPTDLDRKHAHRELLATGSRSTPRALTTEISMRSFFKTQELTSNILHLGLAALFGLACIRVFVHVALLMV
jgi:hypothetical protein